MADDQNEYLLAVTMWLVWTVRPDADSPQIDGHVGLEMSSVSFHRLKDVGPRLVPRAEGGIDATHQLVRFNLYNFGERPVVVCGIALPNVRGETLRCEVVPSVTVGAGARYPMSVEVTNGPIQEAAHIAVDMNGQRVWVAAQSLPKS